MTAQPFVPSRRPPAGRPCVVGIVGAAWRAQMFVGLAHRLPERFHLAAAVVRRAESVAEVERRFEAPAYLEVEEMVERHRPDLVITCVPRAENAAILERLVATGTPVLSETPPAADLEGLRSLWQAVGSRELVQVAEQYLLLPGHAARRELVQSGLLGTPTQVQVSSTHDYHAVSIMRGLLGAASGGFAGCGRVVVSATSSRGPLVNPLVRDAWSGDEGEHDARTVLAAIDLGDGSGLYDFTDNQWHNQLRRRRVVVRASRGEIVDDEVVRLAGERTILRSSIRRSQLGYDLDLAGYDTEHLSFEGAVLWRNPFLGLRLMDEEVAVASAMCASADWCAGVAPAPYPLARACQDQLIGLAVHQSLEQGAAVSVAPEPWSARSG